MIIIHITLTTLIGDPPSAAGDNREPHLCSSFLVGSDVDILSLRHFIIYININI